MPPGVDPESDEGFKLKVNILVSLLVGNSGFPFMVLFFFMNKPREGFIVLWSWIIFMGIPFLARNRVRSNLLAHMLAANYFQCHLFLCLIWGGVEAPNTMWFTAIPVVSVLVGGVTHGLIWSGIAAASILSIYAVEVFEIVEFSSNLTPSQQVFILSMGAVGLLVAIFGSTASFESLRHTAIRERYIAEEALLSEYQRSERLLINTLPVSIARRLKSQQGTIADDFEDASVLFADLVGFTALASQISASETVNLLNEIFSSFDQAVEDYGLEKIKTIGDAYMVAGGVPTASKGHVIDLLSFAQDMLSLLTIHNKNHGHNLRLRVGIASGPITAGVIGTSKFFYDIWGDTVNLASRMESSGIPGRIQVTPRVYERAKAQFDFVERGVIEIKGKGKMTTYLLDEKSSG